MAGPLAGRTAIVTRGSGRIGAVTAVALGEMGADLAVTFGGNGAAAEAVVARLQGLGVRAQRFRADQSDAEQVSRIVANAHAAFGALHILVNNAGVTVKAA